MKIDLKYIIILNVTILFTLILSKIDYTYRIRKYKDFEKRTIPVYIIHSTNNIPEFIITERMHNDY